TLKQMLRDFIGIRVNRAKKSGMVNITSSVNSRERSGINTILHELNPLFTINVTMRDIKSKNVYSRVYYFKAPWMPDRTEANPNELNQDDARYGFRCCHLKNIWTAPLPPETELSRQMTTSTTS